MTNRIICDTKPWDMEKILNQFVRDKNNNNYDNNYDHIHFEKHIARNDLLVQTMFGDFVTIKKGSAFYIEKKK